MNNFVILPLEEVQSTLARSTASGRTHRSEYEYNGTRYAYRTGRIRRIMKQPTCVCCGKVVNHARIVPTSAGTYTLDVGHLGPNDSFVRFTVDHLLLECMGGAYNNANLQIMCEGCNAAKGDLMTLDEINKVRDNPEPFIAEWVNVPYLMYLLDMQEMELRMRADGVHTIKEINRFHIRLSSERNRMTGTKRNPTFNNIYADILRPPVAQPTQIETFGEWFSKMPSIKNVLYTWMYRNNIIFC